MRGTRGLGRRLGTFHARGRGKGTKGSFSFITSSGHGMLVGTLGGTRRASRCMMHMCRARNQGTRDTALAFTKRVVDTDRTGNARGAVNGTAFRKGGLRMGVAPCSMEACGMHLGPSKHRTSPVRCTTLPLSCSHGYTSCGRFHKRNSFRSNCSFTTRLLPSSLVTNRVAFHLKRGRVTGKVSYRNSALRLPTKGGCGHLCVLTTSARKSGRTSFHVNGRATSFIMPSCANFVNR